MERFILIVMIFIIISGCKSESSQTANINSSPIAISRQAPETPLLSPSDKMTLTPIQEPSGTLTITSQTYGEFTKDDLTLDYNGGKLSTNMSLKQLEQLGSWGSQEKLSEGKVKLDNYEGFILFRRQYPADQPLYTVTVDYKVSNGAVNISKIVLQKNARTVKGFKIGDHIDKMYQLYGVPTETENEISTVYSAQYFIGDQVMVVTYDKKDDEILYIVYLQKIEIDKMHINHINDTDEIIDQSDIDYNSKTLHVTMDDRINLILKNFPIQLAALDSVYWFDPIDIYIMKNSPLWNILLEREKGFEKDKVDVMIRHKINSIDLKNRIINVDETMSVKYRKYQKDSYSKEQTENLNYILDKSLLKFIDAKIISKK